jgi:hypothetical protein
MLPTDRGVISVAETGDKLLIFDISDDALERAAPIIGRGGLSSNAKLRYRHCGQLRLPLHGLKVSIGLTCFASSINRICCA